MNLAELARRLQPYLYPPGSGGPPGGVAPIDATYVVIDPSAALTKERFLVQGDGLTMTDGGANGSLIFALTTPGTLTISSTNTNIGNHKHAVTTSSNPGAAAVILATNASGFVQLQGIGVRGAIAPASNASALYAPWVSGDTTPTLFAGSTNSSNNQSAVVAQSYSAVAISGTSVTSYGINGVSTSGYGVRGATATGYGVRGETTGNAGVGVYGYSIGTAGIGIYGESYSGQSGYFYRGNAGTPATPVVQIDLDNVADAQTALQVNSTGTGLVLDVRKSGASKLSVNAAGLTTVTALKIATGVTVAGQVWTATDTVGNGSWQTGGWIGNYVRIIGDTMTGPLIITPSSNSTAVLKVTNSANTATVLDVDTTSKYVGIRKLPASHALDIGYGHINFTTIPTTGAFTSATNGAGVLTGAYRYFCVYVTDEGEIPTATKFTDITVSSNAVRLTVPTGLSDIVTQRKLYRSKIGDVSQPYVMATLADNTTTTYDDNTADAGLGAAYLEARNTTAGKIYINNTQVIAVLGTTVAIGSGAIPNPVGASNIAIGSNAGSNMTTASLDNVIIGTSSGQSLSGGDENIIFGSLAGNGLTTGSNNLIMGYLAGGSGLITGSNNIMIGRAITFSGDFSNSFALGRGLVITANNQGQIGGYFNPTNDIYIGEGFDSDNSVSTTTIQATAGRGTDKGGWHTKIAGGKGTGTGVGGNLLFATSPASTTGSTKNAPVTRITIDSTGLVLVAPPVGIVGLTVKAPASQSVDNFTVVNNASAVLFSVGKNGGTVISQAVENATTPASAFTVTGAAHTAITASTEYTDAKFGLNRNVQWATGALATQRAVQFQAPTYRFVGASTITDAVTVEITDAPIAGTNATITNRYALRVAGGLTQLAELKIAGGGTPASGKVWTGTDSVGNGSWQTPAAAGAPVDATYITISTNATLTNERALAQGAGIVLTDGGAGGFLTIALGTPGTLTVATTNDATTPHKHAITSSSAPGAAASIVATNSNGALALSSTAAVDGLAVTSTNSAAISVHAVASGGIALQAEAATGIVVDFLRTGIGAAASPVLKLRSTNGSDAQPLVTMSHTGTGDFISAGAGAWVLLRDGYTTSPGRVRVTSQFDKVGNTTLADIPGLSVTLRAGRSYIFRAVLFVDNADAIGGYKFAMSGTCTATAIIYRITSNVNGNSGFQISSRQTALGGSAGTAAGTTTYCTIEGLITVNAAGTLTTQFAQNAVSGTSSVLVGSYMEVNDAA